MEHHFKRASVAGFALVFLLCLISSGRAQQINDTKPKNLQGVGIDEHLGDVVPKDTWFLDSKGDTVTIGELLEPDKPVLLTPVYFDCPMLCSLVLHGVYSGISKLDWQVGDEYQVITFSFNHNEGPELAAKYKKAYIDSLGQKGASDSWHFLTGNTEQIQKLTDAIGFNFKYIPERKQFAHNATILFLSPEGKITRYLYGISYSKLNLKNALYDAADGKVGSVVDKVLLYCYQYDPASNSYVPVAFNIMKVGGFATMIILGIFLGLLWLNEKRSKSKKE